MIDYSRRKALKLLGYSSLAGLTGCCIPAARIENHTRETSTIAALKTPDTYFKNTNFMPVIDAHAHFFNATDMQAGGYLSGPIANERGVAGPLVKLVGNVIDFIARAIAPDTHDEWLYLDKLEKIMLNKSYIETQQFLDIELDIQNNKIADALYQELNTQEFIKEYKNALINSGFAQTDILEFSRDTIYISISNDFDELNQLKSYINKDFNFDPRKITALFSFLGRMLNYRVLNMHNYRRAYFHNSDGVKVIAACDALVDFDHWVGCCDSSHSLMQDQIYLHQRLAKLMGGYIFPVVAYNPWSDIKSNYRYLAMVEDAITNRGFKGVKIYPPIGYYPEGNSIAGRYPTDLKHPDLNKLDSALNALYELCVEKNIPVMAHGNHTMGRNNPSKLMAGPESWGNVFKKEGLSSLKVNIGHFGGLHIDHDNNNWSRQFVDVMKTAPGLYADIGNWQDLIEGTNAKSLAKLLKIDLGNNRNASNQVMFGTDWFMLNQNPDWKKYLVNSYQHLLAELTPEEIHSLFYQNAKSLFNI